MIREQDIHSLINFTLNTILSNPFNQDLNKILKCFSYLVSCKLSSKPWINSESWWYSYFPKPKWIGFSWKQKFAPKHGWKNSFDFHQFCLWADHENSCGSQANFVMKVRVFCDILMQCWVVLAYGWVSDILHCFQLSVSLSPRIAYAFVTLFWGIVLPLSKNDHESHENWPSSFAS
jgi:hypothetical protein